MEGRIIAYIGVAVVAILIITSLVIIHNMRSHQLSEEQGKWNDVLQNALKPYPDCKPRPMSTGVLPRKVFCNLPDVPGDFAGVRITVMQGRLSLNDIGPEYYLQPEFYPNWGSVASLMQNPQKDRIAISTPGMYPGDEMIQMYPGQNTSSSVLLFVTQNSMFAIGMAIKPVYPVDLANPMDKSQRFVSNSTLAEKYIRLRVDQEYLFFAPNYPVLPSDWSKKIKLTISVSPEIPPGMYMVGLDLTSPPKDIEAPYVRKWLNGYVSGPQYFINRPYYVAYITIPEE